MAPFPRIIIGDTRAELAKLPAESVDCCVTSPPYWRLRDYGHPGQIGLEATPQEFVASLAAVFSEVHRVLKPTGTLWLNIGDSYAAAGNGGTVGLQSTNKGSSEPGEQLNKPRRAPDGLKKKDLCGIPWRLAFALQDAGWYLRQDIIWSKPNAMPESVEDRCSKSHEYIFLLTKSEAYHFDHHAIMEPVQSDRPASRKRKAGGAGRKELRASGTEYDGEGTHRRKRSVWEISVAQFKGAHFATFPEELPRLCILAGCPQGGTVLDPFSGAGTTCLVAQSLGRHSVGIELNPEYAAIADTRTDTTPGLAL